MKTQMRMGNITLASPDMGQLKFSVDVEKLRICFAAHEGPGRFVILEGMPGAGKTTALTLLASRNDLSLLPELDHVTASGTQEEVLKDSLLESWYIETELDRQSIIREELKSGRYVFQDRSILSTIAFAYARAIIDSNYLGFKRFTERLTSAAVRKLLLPDAMVILLVDQQISLQRRRRFSHQKQYSLWFDTEFLSHYAAFYRNYAYHVVPISLDVLDTSDISPQGLADCLTRTLFERDCLPPNRGETITTVESGK